MKNNRIVLLLMLLIGVSVNAQTYADGAVLPGGTTSSNNWYVNNGTTVTIDGNFNSPTDGRVMGGNFIVKGNYSNTGWTGDDFENGSDIEIFGNLNSTQRIRVLEGATVTIHGDYIDYGGANSYIHGTLIVLGSVDLSGVHIYGNAKVVVANGGIIRNAGGNYSGDIYDLSGGMTGEANSPIPSGGFDDFQDFLDKESDNEDLMKAVEEAGLLSDVDKAIGFTYTALSGTTVDLAWSLNANNDSVLITWSNSDLNDSPEKGVNYEVGSSLSSGSQIVYKGKGTEFSFSGLTEDVTAYFRIWSFSTPDNEFSLPLKLEVRALSSATIFYDGFENGLQPEWYIWTYGGGNNNWCIGTAEAYQGNNSIYISNDGGTSSTYKKNTSSTTDMRLSLSGIPAKYKSVELSFKWKCVGEENNDAGYVIDMGWDAQYGNQSTWVEEIIDITDRISGGSVSVDFRYYVANSSGGVDPGFCIDEVRVIGSEVAKVQAFSGVANSSTEVVLDWTKSVNNDNVLIAYSPYGSIGRPESGKAYSEGDILPGGGWVIYSGPASSYTHAGNFQGKLSYNIWSTLGGEYSTALSTNVNIPVTLPYFEDFESDVSEWTFGAGHNEWQNGSATAYGGSSKSAYISSDRGFTADYDLGSSTDTYMDVFVDLRNYETATMSFYWKADGDNNSYGEVYIDGNRLQSTEGRVTYNNTTSWNEEIINLSSYTNDIKTIRFRWKNNKGGSAQNPGFCIDDVTITGTIANPANFMATNPNDLLNNIDWQQNAYNDKVMIAWSSDGTFGAPIEGAEYDAGDVIDGGGDVLYVGDLLSFEHSPLNYGTIYYYKAWSVRNGTYSSGISTSANTPAKAFALKENWDDTPIPSSLSWGKVSNTVNVWETNKKASIDGNTTNFAFISNNGTDAQYSVITWPTTEAYLDVLVNIDELLTANLSFDWVSDGNNNDYGEVYLNGDRICNVKEFRGQTTWLNKTINLDSYCGKGHGDMTLRFVWKSVNWQANNPGFCIDNIEIGGIYDPTSTISNGQKLSSTISSIANSQADAVSVFSFDLADNASKYNDITRIQEITISKGASNSIAKWKYAIAGAVLIGNDLPSEGLSGTITESGITFTGSDMILLQTEGVAETYTLKVWLHPDISDWGIEEGDTFDFAVRGSDIVTGLGDDFIKANEAESGAIAIDVVATQLEFTQQPSAYGTFGHNLQQIPHVSAVDTNGNVDKDFGASVNLSNSGSLAMTPTVTVANNGVATYTGLQFTGSGSEVVTLSASYSGLSMATSDAIQLDDYCVPSYANNDAFIERVMINTIDNASGKDAEPYVQYLDVETSLLIGTSYDVSVSVYNSGKNNTRHLNIWIDWDGNGVFDANEGFNLGNTKVEDSYETFTGTIIIPEGSDAVVGAHRIRVQYADVNGDACSGSNGETEDYTVVVAANGWQGQNNLWNLPANWSSGEVPTLITDVYIPETPYLGNAYPIIDGAATMNNLEIANNASLTVRPGSLVTVDGDISNSGDLIIENTIAQPSSLMTNPARMVTGNITIKWSYDALRYWFVGHGIANPTMATYRNILIDDPTQKYVLFDYVDGRLHNRAVTPSDFEFSPGDELRGFQFKALKALTLEHTGTLNNASVYQKDVQTGWQIIANPYPAYYQIPLDNGDFAETEGTIYVTSATSNADKTYDVFNTDSGLGSSPEGDPFDGVIAPSQAFYVKTVDTPSAGAKITMSANNCTNSSSTPGLKSEIKTNNTVLRLKLSNEYGLADEAVVALFDDGDFSFTRQDSKQLMYSNTNYSYIYSLVDDEKTVINVLPQSVDNYEQVLGMQTKPGKQQLSISGIKELGQQYTLLLEDKLIGITTIIREDESFVFEAEEGVDHDRFVLHFKASKPNTPTDIDNVDGDTEDVKIYIHDKSTLKISCSWNVADKIVEIYSISGELVANEMFDGEEFDYELDLSTGVYIVRVISGDMAYEQKVFVD